MPFTTLGRRCGSAAYLSDAYITSATGCILLLNHNIIHKTHTPRPLILEVLLYRNRVLGIVA
jgi:hypothetical protein